MKNLSLFLFVLLITISFSNKSFSAEPKVKVMFLDTLYGAAIGAAIGGIVILNDSDNWNKKLALGVTLGAVGGLAFGIVDGFNLLSRNDLPTPIATKPLLTFNKMPNGEKNTSLHLDLVSVYF